MSTDFLSNYGHIKPFAAATTRGSKHAVYYRSSAIKVACTFTRAQDSVNLLRTDDRRGWLDPVVAADEAVANKKVAA